MEIEKQREPESLQIDSKLSINNEGDCETAKCGMLFKLLLESEVFINCIASRSLHNYGVKPAEALMVMSERCMSWFVPNKKFLKDLSWLNLKVLISSCTSVGYKTEFCVRYNHLILEVSGSLQTN